MKEIIKGAVVIDPTFRSEVTLVTIKKSGIFVMPLKFSGQIIQQLTVRGREALRNNFREPRATPPCDRKGRRLLAC